MSDAPRVAFTGFDHLDVRVPSLAAVESFYAVLLPALGLTERRPSFVAGDVWTSVRPDEPYNTVEFFEPATAGRPPRFLGIIEAEEVAPPLTRIALGVQHPDEVRAFAAWLPQIGARAIELSDDMDAYPAVFFEDAVGTRLEICSRRVPLA